jgi:hypothetical protein
MVCQVQVNAIKFLKDKGATDDVRRIINEDLFNQLNDKLTALAEDKYGLQTYGGKLFSINMSEHIDPRTSTYRRDTKYKIYRAIPNEQMFNRLQELYNGTPDKPMFMKTPEVDFSLKIINALDKISRNKFEASKLQGWLNDLQKQGVSAQQIELFKEVAKPGMTKGEIASAIAANYSYTIEINTAKDSFARTDLWSGNEDDGIPLEYRNTQYYSNLTVPGGTNYTENEIATPK